MFNYSTKHSLSRAIILIFFCIAPLSVNGQSIFDQPEKLEALILEKDSEFWQAYNQCDVDKMVSFLSEDLEFYHDKNGFTKGRANMEKSLSGGLCANGPQLRREVKEGTVQVYPLKGIGAIISGEHSFYIGDSHDSDAKFTHLWTLENDSWKMSRILSYDHKLAHEVSSSTAISIDDKLLEKYIGEYLAPQTGKVVFTKAEAKLNMKAGQMQLALLPESKTKFFHKQSSLSFEFVANEAGKVTKVIVREGGKIVEEAKRVN